MNPIEKKIQKNPKTLLMEDCTAATGTLVDCDGTKSTLTSQTDSAIQTFLRSKLQASGCMETSRKAGGMAHVGGCMEQASKSTHLELLLKAIDSRQEASEGFQVDPPFKNNGSYSPKCSLKADELTVHRLRRRMEQSAHSATLVRQHFNPTLLYNSKLSSALSPGRYHNKSRFLKIYSHSPSILILSPTGRTGRKSLARSVTSFGIIMLAKARSVD